MHLAHATLAPRWTKVRMRSRRKRNFFHGPLHPQIDRWVWDKLRVASIEASIRQQPF